MYEVEREIPEIKLNKLGRHLTMSLEESRKMPGEKLKLILTTAPRDEKALYPKARYHPYKKTVIVKNEHDETTLAPSKDGWVDLQSQLPPSPVRTFTSEQRLAMLDDMIDMLGCQVGESPVAMLSAVLADRDQFARAAAKLSAPKPKGGRQAKQDEDEED